MGVQGMFSGWDVVLFEKPDNVFKQNLEKNPIFPFEIIGENVYALTVQSSKYYLHRLITKWRWLGKFVVRFLAYNVALF